jgi:energy-coupling factor transporter transmembrane protein EcfT
MNAPSHRIIETTSLLVLILLCLWLTLFAIYGNYLSIVFILGLIIIFAKAKEPYRKGFIATCLLVGVFLLYPFEVRIKRGDQLQIKTQPISYGLMTPEGFKELERKGGVAGGCIVTPYSARWRLLVVIP